MVDNVKLSEAFQEAFIAGLQKLFSKGSLNLAGKVAWLQDQIARADWIEELKSTPWNVFVEGPPHAKSQPEHVIKYLARYMSGGPIADRRLIKHEQGQVTFWARNGDRNKNVAKSKQNKSEPFTLEGEEFVRRWSMHILPKGYTRSRSYGGFHSTKRKAYLARCRKILQPSDQEATPPKPPERPEPILPTCEQCKAEMQLIDFAPRPSWRVVFEVIVYQGPVYAPTLHIDAVGLPEAHPIEGYG